MRNILTSAMFAGAIAIATVPASAQPLHVDAGFAKSQPIAENVRFGGGGGFHGGGFGGRGFGGRGFAGGRGFGGRGFGGRGYYGGGYGRGFYGRGYGGYGYGGYGYGLATGALLGGALAYPYYYGGYYPSSYYDDNEGETVYQTGRGSNYCARRFKSYDPNSGTYLGNDGRRHSCG